MGQAPSRDDALVEVAVAPNEIIANYWKGVLESENIRAMLKPKGPGMAYFTNFANEHGVYVLASDAVRAREVLEAEAGDAV